MYRDGASVEGILDGLRPPGDPDVAELLGHDVDLYVARRLYCQGLSGDCHIKIVSHGESGADLAHAHVEAASVAVPRDVHAVRPVCV